MTIAGIHIVPSTDTAFPGRAIEMAARRRHGTRGDEYLSHENPSLPAAGFFSTSRISMIERIRSAAWDSFETLGLAVHERPCAYHPGALFGKMVATAGKSPIRSAASSRTRTATLTGRHRGDNHQIEDIEEKMRAFGIPPGSETALKLFNEAATL
jgi:hypothetical protein